MYELHVKDSTIPHNNNQNKMGEKCLMCWEENIPLHVNCSQCKRDYACSPCRKKWTRSGCIWCNHTTPHKVHWFTILLTIITVVMLVADSVENTWVYDLTPSRRPMEAPVRGWCMILGVYLGRSILFEDIDWVQPQIRFAGIAIIVTIAMLCTHLLIYMECRRVHKRYPECMQYKDDLDLFFHCLRCLRNNGADYCL